jgi:hypothetical protein
MGVRELAARLGDVPDHAREPSGEQTGFWTRIGETAGKRDFFGEVAVAISWLEDRRGDVEQIVGTGGAVSVICNLPGDRNIGSELTPEVMRRAASLGVSVGVEVFPQISGVTDR